MFRCLLLIEAAYALRQRSKGADISTKSALRKNTPTGPKKSVGFKDRAAVLVTNQPYQFKNGDPKYGLIHFQQHGDQMNGGDWLPSKTEHPWVHEFEVPATADENGHASVPELMNDQFESSGDLFEADGRIFERREAGGATHNSNKEFKEYTDAAEAMRLRKRVKTANFIDAAAAHRNAVEFWKQEFPEHYAAALKQAILDDIKTRNPKIFIDHTSKQTHGVGVGRTLYHVNIPLSNGQTIEQTLRFHTMFNFAHDKDANWRAIPSKLNPFGNFESGISGRIDQFNTWFGGLSADEKASFVETILFTNKDKPYKMNLEQAERYAKSLNTQ